MLPVPAHTDCSCNDYAMLTANNGGIAVIRVANPNLNGSGNVQAVITAGDNGTTIRSIIIKAVNPVTTGMVRLYIFRSAVQPNIFKEIPVSTTPQLPATPVPAPMLLTYETRLVGGLQMQAGDVLYASTQNDEAFNVIAEGLDWSYPEDPEVCCNFNQERARTGLAMIFAANPHTDGTGFIIPVFSGATGHGSYLKSITIKALQNTHEGAIRIFINNGVRWFLMQEIFVPQTARSAYDPSFKHVVEMDFYLQEKYIIGVSTNNSEVFAITAEGMDWSYP